MSIPMNERLLHQMHGNSQLAQYIMCRFREHYPMLLQLFSQAWTRGDAAALHAIGARLASHLRVVGLDDDVEISRSISNYIGDLYFQDAFVGTRCASTSCGVKHVAGGCAPPIVNAARRLSAGAALVALALAHN